MKRWACASLVVLALLAGSVMPGEAHGFRHFHHGGPRFFVGFSVAPAWWYPYPYWWYYPPYVYAPPPTVVVQQPPVYIEQQPAPPPTSAPAEPTQYWYYCVPSGAYYPNVQTCSEPWVKVPARRQQ
jgi:hypothetical protein